MNVPDCISPIVGYRVWQWDVTGLRSLNGEPWRPGKTVAARCKVSATAIGPDRAEFRDGSHEAPEANCTCGIYAAKNRNDLQKTGYDAYGIHGEVYLWGVVVEHETGWRAQYALPKRLFLPTASLPFTLAGIESRLKRLVTYHADIYIADANESIRLWTKNSGYDPAGLDYLIELRKEYYVCHRQERTLKKGDRVAILGSGIAVVKQMTGNQVRALLWNRSFLNIGFKNIVWDDGNMRWEAKQEGVFQTREDNHAGLA